MGRFNYFDISRELVGTQRSDVKRGEGDVRSEIRLMVVVVWGQYVGMTGADPYA